ncbi:MAG: hypothetical protein IT337_16260 [Thermomicrobiales bacterium]|nr:hypothetical protein [Thermomicrobiales bacterium]
MTEDRTEHASDSAKTASTAKQRRRERRHLWHRVALGATVLIVIGIIAMMPFVLHSMQDVLGRSSNTQFAVISGKETDPSAAMLSDVSYFNFGLIDLDVNSGQITIAVSGNRVCAATCPTLTITLVALDDNADERRGLPPTAKVTLGPDDRIFSESVELPVRGQPSLYPFDTYELWLGLAVRVTAPDGTNIPVDPTSVADHVSVTLQNRISTMVMQPPGSVAPQTVEAATDPFTFAVVRSLTLERPVYLKLMAVSLVLLVAVSAALALFMRSMDELLLGIGGLVLGVWGVRSVLMPQSLPTVTAVDLALSWVILLLLLGLALRAAHYFFRQSGLPVPHWLGKRD